MGVSAASGQHADPGAPTLMPRLLCQERAVAGVEWRAPNPNPNTAPRDKKPYRGQLNFFLC